MNPEQVIWDAGYVRLITSPPEGFARYCFHQVCMCVCVRLCVCPANILVLYFSAIRRYINLKYIQDTYRVVLNSLKKTLTFIGQRDGTLLCEGTFILHKLSHRKISISFFRILYSMKQ